MARGFCQTNIARNGGGKELVGEMLLELGAHFYRQTAAAVIHGANDAHNIQLWINGLADFAYGGNQV